MNNAVCTTNDKKNTFAFFIIFTEWKYDGRNTGIEKQNEICYDNYMCRFMTLLIRITDVSANQIKYFRL